MATKPGVQVMIEPQTFSVDGCVKFAYPHSHNEALFIALENQTRKQPLRRTVPDVTRLMERYVGFPKRQVYSDPASFPVSTQEEYRMVLGHIPLPMNGDIRGMGNYLRYMTRETCPTLGQRMENNPY